MAFDVETRVSDTCQGVYTSNVNLVMTEIETRRTLLLSVLFDWRCEGGYVLQPEVRPNLTLRALTSSTGTRSFADNEYDVSGYVLRINVTTAQH